MEETMNQLRRFVCLFVATGLLLVLSSGALAYDQLLAPEVEMGDLDYFGYSVAVDGNLAVVGVPAFAGGSVEPSRAYIFENTASGWAVLTRLQPSVDANDEYYGSAVAISS